MVTISYTIINSVTTCYGNSHRVENMNKRSTLHVVPDVPELKNIKKDKVKRRGFKKLDEHMNIIPCTYIYDHPAKVLTPEERRWYENKYLPTVPGYEEKESTSEGTFSPPDEYEVDKNIDD